MILWKRNSDIRMFGMIHKSLLAANICDSLRVAHPRESITRLIILPSYFGGSRGAILLCQKGTSTSSQLSKTNLNGLAAYHTICGGYSKGGRSHRKSTQAPFRKGSRGFKSDVEGKEKHSSHPATEGCSFPPES